jgi:hypothetical protein
MLFVPLNEYIVMGFEFRRSRYAKTGVTMFNARNATSHIARSELLGNEEMVDSRLLYRILLCLRVYTINARATLHLLSPT